MEAATLERSETSHQVTKNGMLDYISYLEDCRRRAHEYMLSAVREGLLPEFEVAEIGLLLYEARDDSDKRRWAQSEEEDAHG